MAFFFVSSSVPWPQQRHELLTKKLRLEDELQEQIDDMKYLFRSVDKSYFQDELNLFRLEDQEKYIADLLGQLALIQKILPQEFEENRIKREIGRQLRKLESRKNILLKKAKQLPSSDQSVTMIERFRRGVRKNFSRFWCGLRKCYCYRGEGSPQNC